VSNYIAWRGAVEFSGFPVNLALYARVRGSKGNGSFRMLAPNTGNPVAQQLVDSETGAVVERAETRKGVEVAKDTYEALSDEQVALIEDGAKTQLAELRQFAPLDTIDWTLATATYAVRADDKVPGSASAVNILWNGLQSTGLAYLTQMSMRAGSDVILAIYADEGGMWAATLPFEHVVYDVPEPSFEPDPKARALFAQVVEAHYGDQVKGYDPADYASEAKARRDAVVAAVLAGSEVEAPEAKPVPAAPSLMDLMAASVEGAKK
jgi:non-homologous end joining protein Ku